MTALTYRRVLRIAAPIVLSNATIPLLGAVDTAVIGQLGQAAPLGAVGLGAIILTTLYWIFGFLRMSTSGLAAQAHGAGDLPERAAVLSGLGARSVVIADPAAAVADWRGQRRGLDLMPWLLIAALLCWLGEGLLAARGPR